MFNHIYMLNLQQARENPDFLGKTVFDVMWNGDGGAGLLVSFYL